MTIGRRSLETILFGFAALFVVLVLRYPSYLGSLVVKAIPAQSLAILAWRHVAGSEGRWIAFVLLLSAMGDAVLGLNDRHGGLDFVVGLGLFLVAHLLYIIALATRFRLHRSRIPAVVVILLCSAILAYILFPHLGKMVIPVSGYLIVITGMGLLAALRRMAGRGLLSGALAFPLSDSLIAVDRFLAPVPAPSCAIIITYYSAQHAITHSFLEEARGFG